MKSKEKIEQLQKELREFRDGEQIREWLLGTNFEGGLKDKTLIKMLKTFEDINFFEDTKDNPAFYIENMNNKISNYAEMFAKPFMPLSTGKKDTSFFEHVCKTIKSHDMTYTFDLYERILQLRRLEKILDTYRPVKNKVVKKKEGETK